MRTSSYLTEFTEQLKDALKHLYDLDYEPTELLWTGLGHRPDEGTEVLQRSIVSAIEGLRPPSDIPPGASSRRIYELLHLRYVKGLTQEEAAERLGMSSRHLRREQDQAIAVLARRLWERGVAGHATTTTSFELAEGSSSVAWRSQVREELVALQQSAPGIVANVGDTIQGVMELGKALFSEQDITLHMDEVAPGLAVSTHPSVVRQILITALEKLADRLLRGHVTLQAQRQERYIRITITATPAPDITPSESDFIREILAMQGGSVQSHMQDDRLVIELLLPAADRVAVLVIDDNADLVHFYRRYTTGTRYDISHIAEGRQVLTTIDAAPDIIVLDVMLPDMDGWELLTQLREHPKTRAVPIIVCSVVRRGELARTLGAALYVPKPVRRQEFIAALDQASNWLQQREESSSEHRRN